jgi:DUF1009 family protein
MPSNLTILPDPPPPPAPIGLIAGGGRLPIFVAEGLRDMGYSVHAVGLHRQYDPDLPGHCNSFQDVGLLRIGSWGRTLRRHGVRHAIMVGKVDKANLMHDKWRVFKNVPDLATALAWYRKLRHDRRSHAVLKAVADELDRKGVSLIDSTIPIPDQLAAPGVMTATSPTTEQRADIELVWPMLAELLRLDIGQAITVRDRDVISVEAVEGTDRMIERTGELCKRGGWTLVKGARAQHDRRSDVPTVGVRTIEHMARHGGRCLAIAAGDVIMLDRDEMIRRADDLGVAIIGVPMAHATAGVRPAQAAAPEAKPTAGAPARPVQGPAPAAPNRKPGPAGAVR